MRLDILAPGSLEKRKIVSSCTEDHSVNLEAHSITVRFAKGSMGFIANGLLELIQKP